MENRIKEDGQEKKAEGFVSLDPNQKVGTNIAIVEALRGKVTDEFLPYGLGNAGVVCEIKEIGLDNFVAKCKKVFGVPYVDQAGRRIEVVTSGQVVAVKSENYSYPPVTKIVVPFT